MCTEVKIRALALALLLATLSVVAVSHAEETAVGEGEFPELCGPYLGQPLPGEKPVLFAPGVVSTDLHDDFSPAFTPDCKEVFFRCIGNGRMVILHMTQDSNCWTYPEVASFSGEYRDLGVFISHEGDRLFFSSDRPVNEADTTGDMDIFAVDREYSGWGEPHGLFSGRAGSGDDFGCSVDSSGTVYYYSRRSEGCGGYDIYQSRLVDGAYASAELMPAPVNTPGDETCPCIAHDGSFLVYNSDRTPTGERCYALYAVFRSPDGSWTNPVSLTQHLGLTVPAKFAGLSPDGRYMFFVAAESKDANRSLGRRWGINAFQGAQPRYGGGNVYWFDSSVIEKLRPGK